MAAILHPMRAFARRGTIKPPTDWRTLKVDTEGHWNLPSRVEAKRRRAEFIALALHFSMWIKSGAGSQKVCPCRSDAKMRQAWAILLSLPPIKPSRGLAGDLD